MLESISNLNPLNNVDINRLNSMLKRKRRSKAENEKFVRLLSAEMMRVDELYTSYLGELDALQIDAESKEDMFFLVHRCTLVEDFVVLNRRAVHRMKDRFRWLTEGTSAADAVAALDASFMSCYAHEDMKRSCLSRLGPASSEVADSFVRKRREGDGLGWLGFFGGVALALLVLLVVLLASFDASGHSLWKPSHRVYRMFLLLALYFLFMALVVLVCSVLSIDWAFVFGFDHTRYLRARHYALVSCQLAVITLFFACGFLLHLRADPSSSTLAEWWIFGVVLAHILFLINPFPFGHRPSRWWLLRTLARVLGAPFVGPLQFRDFWLADQLTSAVILVTDMAYTGCYFALDFLRNQNQCEATYVPIFRPVFAALPFLIRFLQCIRRYYDDRNSRDLVNMGKYFSSLLLLLFAVLHTDLEGGTNPWGPLRIVWLLFAVEATLYGFSWDVLMDWGIGRPHFNLLRRHLVFPKWCYYVAMPINLVLRCAWTFTVAPSPFTGYVYEKALEFSLAAAELLRRAHWNMYRFANEQTQMERALRFVEDDLPADTFEREAQNKNALDAAMSVNNSSSSGDEAFVVAPRSQQLRPIQEAEPLLLGSDDDIRANL